MAFVINVALLPAPIRLICLLIDNELDQVDLPAGTSTVSPGEAALTAACTSESDALTALLVAAIPADAQPNIVDVATSNTKLASMRFIHNLGRPPCLSF